VDATALVGTNYYVVASVNPNGSTNSSPVSVILTATAPPQISSARVASGSFVFTGGGGNPGQNYYVLTATNAALPLAQWTRIATNIVDANGGYYFSNNINASSARQFYVLQLP
jgi:hypothetical protein